MLYNLLSPLAEDFAIFNLFRYLTFRTGGAIMTALLISFIFGPTVINWLKSKQHRGQPIRDDGPESHIIAKQGTPTMGGFLILLALGFGTLLWADLSNQFVWSVLLVTLGFGAIGFADDYLKVSRHNPKGVPGKLKLLLEIVIAFAATYWIVKASHPDIATGLTIPFLKDVLLDLGWFYIPFGMFVMVGASNAVNLTDGLDGLAIVPVMIAAASFGLIAYLVGNAVFSNYLQIQTVPGSGELLVFCGALIGAGLGFLWFNTYPAQVFMGDVGALALGAALGVVAIIIRLEIVLLIMGGLFVVETASVIMQVASFRLTGKRIFRMAPIHHHFELKGWPEPKVIVRLWIVTLVLVTIGLSTLKLR